MTLPVFLFPFFQIPPALLVANFIPPPPFPGTYYNINFYGDNILTTVTKTAATVDNWIQGILYVIHSTNAPPRPKIVGLDTEWLPNLDAGDDHPTAIIQLCVQNYCLIFQVLHAGHIPQSLRWFLANPDFAFVGVGVSDDAEKLFKHHGLAVGRAVDLGPIAAEMYGRMQWIGRMGLKAMARWVLGKEMKKPRSVTMSKWDAENLDGDQVEYACIDAFVSFLLGLALLK